MALFNLVQRESVDRDAALFAYMTDEELIDKGFGLGREANFERYLLPHQREELRGIKALLLARLGNKKPPR